MRLLHCWHQGLFLCLLFAWSRIHENATQDITTRDYNTIKPPWASKGWLGLHQNYQRHAWSQTSSPSCKWTLSAPPGPLWLCTSTTHSFSLETWIQWNPFCPCRGWFWHKIPFWNSNQPSPASPAGQVRYRCWPCWHKVSRFFTWVVLPWAKSLSLYSKLC